MQRQKRIAGWIHATNHLIYEVVLLDQHKNCRMVLYGNYLIENLNYTLDDSFSDLIITSIFMPIAPENPGFVSAKSSRQPTSVSG
jgi:hypothetical protein